MLVRHKVDKLDTLAGLAVKYNVTVSDIKRCNGLLSDSAMFARDTLLIPTKPLSIGPEYSTWAGMIVTHYGRITAEDIGPGSAPFSHLRTATSSIEQLRGYYSTEHRQPPRQYPAGASEEDEQWQLLGNGSGSSSSGGGGLAPREVELMQLADVVPSTSALTDDSLRRRKQSDAIASSYMHVMEADASPMTLGPAGPGSALPRPTSFGRLGGAAAAAEASGGGRTPVRWKDRLLGAATQPPLLGLQPFAGAPMAAPAAVGPASGGCKSRKAD